MKAVAQCWQRRKSEGRSLKGRGEGKGTVKGKGASFALTLEEQAHTSALTASSWQQPEPEPEPRLKGGVPPFMILYSLTGLLEPERRSSEPPLPHFDDFLEHPHVSDTYMKNSNRPRRSSFSRASQMRTIESVCLADPLHCPFKSRKAPVWLAETQLSALRDVAGSAGRPTLYSAHEASTKGINV